MGISDITVAALTATPTLRGNKLAWTYSDPFSGALPNIALDMVEVWSSTTNDRTTATKAGEGILDFTHAGLVEEQTYYYWIRARDMLPAANGGPGYGAWYPSGSTSGVACSALGMSGLVFGLANGKIVTSVGSSALTIAVKTSAGNDPSASDPVFLAFRSSTQTSGAYVIRQITAAMSLVISNGSTLDMISNTPFRVRVAIFDDAGTLRLAVKTSSASNGTIYATAETGIASAVAEGGAGGADTINVFYAGATITSKPYRLIASLDWNSGLASAGAWSAGPDVINPAYPGTLAPGTLLKERAFSDLTFSGTSTALIPLDNTKPQNTEGSAYTSESITPESPCNIFDIFVSMNVAHSVASEVIIALFRDSGADAIAAGIGYVAAANKPTCIEVRFRIQAGDAAARTYAIRLGAVVAGTLSINGISGAATLGGVLANYESIKELAG